MNYESYRMVNEVWQLLMLFLGNDEWFFRWFKLALYRLEKKNSQGAQWKTQIQLQEQEALRREGWKRLEVQIPTVLSQTAQQRMVAFGSRESMGVYTYKLSLQTHGYI